MTRSSDRPCIVWLRRDLRISDNPALAAAHASGRPIVPLFVWSPEEDTTDARAGDWAPGSASRWWLHHSLVALDDALRHRGLTLVVRRGTALDALQRVAEETGAAAVRWNRLYDPDTIARDRSIRSALGEGGLDVTSTPGSVLMEPHALKTTTGGPYRVYTPFWKALQREYTPPKRLDVPARLRGLDRDLESTSIDALGLLPSIDWAGGLRDAWTPGEVGAETLLGRAIADVVPDYADERDRPDHRGTSRLSAHLHFGEVSVADVWRRVSDEVPGKQALPYLRQLAWRDFAHHLLFHFPTTTDTPLRNEFAAFPWAEDAAALRHWQRGRTGYPIVDAGMRELWTTGWMHNRVRMIVGSFLVKNLLQSWTEGAAWFWDTLVDADLANNTFGWQWIGGCGADAAPYFRIFNPILQSRRFDPDGEYVRRWVPELAKLPARAIAAPWEASPTLLAEAGVTLGRDYPHPIVELRPSRNRALAAYEDMRSSSKRAP